MGYVCIALTRLYGRRSCAYVVVDVITLYEHQKTALSLLRLNDGFALFMEQGTGKTFPVLFRLAELAAGGRIESALIVAPKAVCESWVAKRKMLDYGRRQVLRGIRLEVVSYDMVWRREAYTKGSWDAVVLDESHYIKTPSTKRTKACLKICSQARYRYILTGTPVTNGQLCNLWAQLAAIDPVVVSGRVYPRCLGGDSYYKWIERVAWLDQWHQPKKYRDVAALQEIMGEWSYRITKAECLDLPDKLPDEILHVKLSDNALKAHKDMAKHSAIMSLDTIAGNPLTRSLRLRQIASGFVETDDGETVQFNNAKIPILREFLSDWEGKIVIYAEFRRSIDAISKLLGELKMPHVVLDGRQSDKGIWRKFQSDENIRAIVCQYQSGSAGIDLYAADTMLFYEPSLSSNLTEQARDRIHRIGQRKPCSYYWLLTDSIEQGIYKALASYADFSEALFNQWIGEYTKGQRLTA